MLETLKELGGVLLNMKIMAFGLGRAAKNTI
jgi:hypothetical protein